MKAETSFSPNEALVTRSQTGALLTLSLNRGDRFNPLSLSMIAALEGELDAITADTSVRVVILRGEGRGFCAGHDLREMREHAADGEWQRQLFASCNRMMIVSMCDIAIAEEGAKFAMPGVNIGVFCSTPAVGVARNIGRKRSMEMLLTGDEIGAAQALDWGLVNRVVAADRLDAEVARFAETILKRSGAAIAIGKRSFYEQLECAMPGAYEIAGRTMVRNVLLADAVEGMDAFLNKREPAWRNT
jgi:enoyl-CoA hydratase/carnithine racemase